MRFPQTLLGRLRSICNIPFAAALMLLLANDFILKPLFHNWITGKLSDIAGIFVFVSFWIALFPRHRAIVCLLTAALFVWWKSPLSQVVIDFCAQHLFGIDRVVDYSDLMALAVIPVAFKVSQIAIPQYNINPLFPAVVTLIAFCATSTPRHIQHFDEPQYLVYRNSPQFDYSRSLEGIDLIVMDTLVIIRVDEIQSHLYPRLADDFHRVTVEQNLDKEIFPLIIRDSATKNESTFDSLRSQLTIAKEVTCNIKMDSIIDSATFLNSRLHGGFVRRTEGGKLLVRGYYRRGVEDSVWTYYERSGMTHELYFQDGERVRQISYRKGESKVINFTTRERTLFNEYARMIVMIIIEIGTAILIARYCIRTDKVPSGRVSMLLRLALVLSLPVMTYVAAYLLSSLTLHSSAVPSIFRIAPDVGVIFLAWVPVYCVMFLAPQQRSRINLWLVMLFFIVAMLMVWEVQFIFDIRR